MLERDWRRYSWYAANVDNVVAIRLDLRGTGDSHGEPLHDEYLQKHELDDGYHVLEYLASLRWSNGCTALTGKSWSGFNSLQIAMMNPPSLKCIVSVAATDDRYAEDVHYSGGTLLANDVLQWASVMLAYNAQPPSHPEEVFTRTSDTSSSKHEEEQQKTECEHNAPENAIRRSTAAEEEYARSLPPFEETWLARLKKTPHMLRQWLRPENQVRSSFWKHGSLCEDYAKIRVPVLACGGWYDGYTQFVGNCVARCVSSPLVYGLIGPWAHHFPESVPTCPAAEMPFLDESALFLRAFLFDDKDESSSNNNNSARKQLRAFLLSGGGCGEQKTNFSRVLRLWRGDVSSAPSSTPFVSRNPASAPRGQWIQVALDDKGRAVKNNVTTFIGAQSAIGKAAAATARGASSTHSVDSTAPQFRLLNGDQILCRVPPPHPLLGSGMGTWWGTAENGELPGDQRFCDSLSLRLDFDVKSRCLEKEEGTRYYFDIIGVPILTFQFRVTGQKRAMLAVRLCAVNKRTGVSQLLSWSVLNLAHQLHGEAAETIDSAAAGRDAEHDSDFLSRLPSSTHDIVLDDASSLDLRTVRALRLRPCAHRIAFESSDDDVILRLSFSSSLFPTSWPSPASEVECQDPASAGIEISVSSLILSLPALEHATLQRLPLAYSQQQQQQQPTLHLKSVTIVPPVLHAGRRDQVLDFTSGAVTRRLADDSGLVLFPTLHGVLSRGLFESEMVFRPPSVGKNNNADDDDADDDDDEEEKSPASMSCHHLVARGTNGLYLATTETWTSLRATQTEFVIWSKLVASIKYESENETLKIFEKQEQFRLRRNGV